MVLKKYAIEITNTKVFPFQEFLQEFLLDSNMYSKVHST